MALYAAPPARPTLAAMLLVLMMLPAPRAAIDGANAPTSMKAARTLLANIKSNRAISKSAVGPQTADPALLTKMSRSPTSTAN